jgi:hypothetical protein
MHARVMFSLLMLWALAFPALAAGRGAPSLDRVLPEIRRSTPGTFYDADGPFIGPNGQASYRIKWMTPDGRIIWFYADARTGQVYGATPGANFPNPFPQPNRFRGDYPDRFGDGGWPPGGRDYDGRENRGRDWNGRRGGDWNGRGGGDGRGHGRRHGG